MWLPSWEKCESHINTPRSDCKSRGQQQHLSGITSMTEASKHLTNVGI